MAQRTRPVACDLAAEVDRNGVQSRHECVEIIAFLVYQAIVCHSVGQDGHHIVCGGIPVDTDHVERVGYV